MELLRRNPRLESMPDNERVEVMKQFYKISNDLIEPNDDESGEETQDRTDRICIKTVIEREKARISFFNNGSHRLYESYSMIQHCPKFAVF